ncbi:hypothetical protein TrLO_g13623 [Triparma laevis f. longispina]|uniref:asparagine synthase (glutamine-hydrolyzing) n=1 Tax=Triparma laevis f. longispina TaxID=1714387 RepID=A0A9W7A2H3_9STRA|nr:hypothetical protein TrLO_g13623 [Triparma laevis f. longispina]
MCGIFAIFNSTDATLRKTLIACSETLRHRGPDWSGYEIIDSPTGTTHGIAHERLAIMDPESGAQPLKSRDQTVTVAANGEIYNYKDLYTEFPDYKPQTGSDCEVILPLYEKYGPSIEMANGLRGMFSFVLHDSKTDTFVAVRDHMGITPLYIGWGDDGSTWFASEMKALVGHCKVLKQFPPGHVYCNKGKDAKQFVRWYSPDYVTDVTPVGGPLPTQAYNASALRNAFEAAVVRRMMSDVPWGVLLSGGLDSSLVASIASRHIARKSTNFPKLHSFSVGLSDSSDLPAAKKVADFLGTIHHEYTYTIQEGLDAIEQVIKHVETYDVTTIRSSTPMFLMARKIKAMGIKMVLSGEGADEVFGGYLYFHKAPNAREFHEETVDKLSRLYMYDCLRCNKSMSSWGVEPRVPFLDADFLDLAMSLDPEEKRIRTKNLAKPEDKRIEKWAVRKAFDTPDDPYLPDEILWRQKEQFSDGVGYGWVDALKDAAEAEISDQMFENAANRYEYNTPLTKEGFRYRQIFERLFPGKAAYETVPGGKSIACSTERAMSWDASFAGRADPSGRAAGVHDDAYDNSFVADDNEKIESSKKKRKL